MPSVQRSHGTRAERRRVHNPAGLSYWKRKQKLEANPDQERDWLLTCRECGHVGMITCSLRRLRARNLVCSECGVVLTRR